MRRADSHDRFGGTAGRIVGAIALAGAGLLVVTQLGSIMRYLHLWRISAGKHAVPFPRDAGAPSAAQTPRWGTEHWPRG